MHRNSTNPMDASSSLLSSSYVPVIACGWMEPYNGIFAFCFFI